MFVDGCDCIIYYHNKATWKRMLKRQGKHIPLKNDY